MPSNEDANLCSDDIGKVGESAVQLFFQMWRWHPRKEADDQGVDFSVEIPRAPDGVRRRFLVQVKTSNPMLCLKNGDWSVSVDQGALRKYISTREPVFLIAVDLPSNSLRFVHVQPWIAETAHPLTGPKDAQVKLRIDNTKTIEPDHADAFISTVIEAWSYQDAKHFPAPVAIGRMESELSKLDRRFDIEVTATRHGNKISISANEPVEAGVFLSPSSLGDAEGLTEAIKFGSSTKVNVDDMEMRGSPLFQNMPRGPASLELLAHPRRVTLRLGRIHVKKPRNTLKKLIELPGEMTKGSHGIEIKTATSVVPFHLAFRSDHTVKQAKVDLSLLLERLEGTPLKALPHINCLHEVLTAGAEGDLGMQVLVDGKLAPPPIRIKLEAQQGNNREEFTVLASQMAALIGLSWAAKQGRSEALWGPLAGITRDDHRTWMQAWSLLKEGGTLIEPGAVPVDVTHPEVLFDDESNLGFLILKGAEFSVTGWGTEICRVPVSIEFHGHKVTRIGASTAMIQPIVGSTAIMRLAKKRNTV